MDPIVKSIEDGLKYLEDHPGTSFVFNAVSVKDVFPALVRAGNSAAQDLDDAMDGGGHSGWSFQQAVEGLLQGAKEKGCEVVMSPDKGQFSIITPNP